MRREVGALLAALVLYSGFYGAFFIQSFLSGNYIAPSDSLDFGVAAYLSAPALWTQGMYSGYPLAADPQSLIWYPVLHMFRLAGLDWNIFLISAYVIASATCFLLVRRLTGSNMAGAFGGVVYGFSGVMLGHIGQFNQIHAAAWVPLVLYGLQLIREGWNRPGTAVTALAFAMMWLAGHPQVPLYATYTCVAVVLGGLLVDRPSRSVGLTRLGWSSVGVALGLALAAVSILPMIELGGFSRRAGDTWELYASKSMPAWDFLTLVLPLVFGGFWTGTGFTVPYVGDAGTAGAAAYTGMLPLALAGAVVVSRNRREGWVWITIAAVAAVLCLGAATPIGVLFYYVPGYAALRAPVRHLFIVALCLSVGSSLVVADVIGRRETRGLVGRAVLVLLAATAGVFAALAFYHPAVRALLQHNGDYVTWALVWPAAVAGAVLAWTVIGRWLPNTHTGAVAFGVLLTALHVGDLLMVHYRIPGRRFEYADILRDEAILRPRMMTLRDELTRSGERVLATDGSKNPFLLPNLTRAWNMPAASGTGSLGIERYLDVLGMGGPGDVYPETLSAPHRGLDLFSIGYALVPQESPLAADLRKDGARWAAMDDLQYYKHDPDTRYTLFKNARALPRAWCVPSTVRVTPDEGLAAIRTGHLPGGRGEFDPTRVALVEEDALRGWTATGAATARAEVVVNMGRNPRYLVRTDEPCVLVLSEVHYVWWRASLDDRTVEVVRVNHAMIGIAVPKGSHVVRLWLEPVSVWIGGALAGAGLLLWSALLLPLGVPFRRHAQIPAPEPVSSQSY